MPEDIVYGNVRREMLKYIPAGCKRTLEVGCSAGDFSILLKNQFNCEVWGVEMDPTLADIASKNLDKFFSGDFNAIINDLPDHYFDCIIFNDVLEHFVDPFEILKECKNKLNHSGHIVCSIPNVRYFRNIIEFLFKKDWKYRIEGGILDITHLRFFTYNSILRMFDEAGYQVCTIEGISKSGNDLLKFFNMLTFGFFSDVKYMQFACVVKLK